MRQYQSLLQLAELFDCVADVLVWVKDCDGRYCWVNRAFLLNYVMDGRDHDGPDSGIESILGKTDYDLSPAFLADQFRLDDESVLAGKRIVNRIELVGQPDGLTVWNVTNKIPLVGDDGSVIGTAGITRRLDTPRKDIAPVQNSARSWPTCAIITTLRSPTGSSHGWHTCRSGPSSANSAAASTLHLRNTCASFRCGWLAGPWFTRANRLPRWLSAAASQTKATSHVNFAVILAVLPASIANITPGELVPTLLLQFLPLASNNRCLLAPYNPSLTFVHLRGIPLCRNQEPLSAPLSAEL